MHGAAFASAVIGGAIWGLGVLGRRLGVTDAKVDGDLSILSAYTFTVYSFGSAVIPMIDYLIMSDTDKEAGMKDNTWWQTVPILVMCAAASSLGGFTACYALALSNKCSSCMVAMVETGVYSVAGAALIVLVLGGHPELHMYASGAFIIIGILLLHFKKAGPTSFNDYGATAGGRTSADGGHASKAYLFAGLAGILWALGILGKRYSVARGPHETARARATLTYALYTLFGTIPALLFLSYEFFNGRLLRGGPGNDWLSHRAPLVLAGALVSGLGGCIVTYALAVAAADEAALVTLIADGVYTVTGAAFVAIAFNEKLEPTQWLGAACIALAVALAH